MLFGKKKRQIVRLLVVEDEPLVAFDTEYFLAEADFTIVATIDRVAEALLILESDTVVDLVLVDVNLADGSGIDVARAAQAGGVPVMFVTGSCPVEATSLAAGCMAKPYVPRDLIAAIEAIEAMIGGKKPKRVPSGFTLFEAKA
ncbi:response regulator [Sphingomonas albertensis]|uniref:Response regulator n=1 Tax=Sphingomonas albertensis TaxID=2762591 RepID=A0ABR7AT71_9SPHN|nr:response regulator [Sphingomonas albertensis]MBC3943656.1 response regulator [Sphingomonas albertensis]